MKVTPLNIGRFWKRLMFPPTTSNYHLDRLSLKMDMPWEPWLHCAVWWGTLIVLIRGEKNVLPPVGGFDWLWIAFGLLSPMIGFMSVWVLAFHKGKPRYVAIWTRMVSDIGLALAIALYQIDRFSDGSSVSVEVGIISTTVLTFSMWFTLALVWRDIKFIVATEKLAMVIYHNVREVRIGEWSEWVDNAS